MNATNKKPKSNEQYGISTKLWSTLCHSCDICKFANKKPESRFNKVMVWHRTWCPGWSGHTKVYGLKDLS